MQFILKVRHDRGVIRVRTVASNADAAKRAVMAAERCPERSIVDIRAVTPTGFELVAQGERAGELVQLAIPASSVIRDAESPRNPYASGYGSKIPTAYRVRTVDQKWRRVYIRQYANVGTTYVMHDGIKTIVEIESC